ncbi:MAG: TonB-dependent receptor [Woeseiaceae bacterium]|nr:TonB-dependent receptor [Woeseiaceae bacterium]
MKSLFKPVSLALASGILASFALPAGVALAQDDEAVEEIVTIGTRVRGRTEVDTAVPVDVFNTEELDSVSSDDMLDIIKTLVPSFQVGRLPLNDGASFIRPPTLRGLDSDKALVLVNGKRRHRSALVRLGDFGSHGPDLATIPSIAVKSVEVLRDGAAAQYGSDAIAGVINFNLKNDAEGGEARVQMGQYSDEDNAEEWLAALNFGIALGQNGFLNTSFEVSEADPTSRGAPYEITIEGSGRTPQQAATDSGTFTITDFNGADLFVDQQRFGPDSHTEIWAPDGRLISLIEGSDGILDDRDTRYADNICHAEIGQGNCLTQIWGMPDRDAIRAFVNAGYDFGGTEVYAFANYSDSNSNTGFFHRRPGIPQLQMLRLPDGTIYNPRDRYPAGFTPRFFGNVVDYSFTGGVRGEFNNGMSYDFSGRFGHDDISYEMQNTMNPSMGPRSPRVFRPGTLVNEETEFNADFSIPLDLGWNDDVNLAFGLSWRDEGYDIEAGDPASFEIGPYASVDPWNFEITDDEVTAGTNDNWFGTGLAAGCYIPGNQGTPYFGAGAAPGADTASGQYCVAGDPIYSVTPVGSNGFPGYGPQFTSQYDRDSWAVYVDLESELTDAFLLNVAGRYEDYSDFGTNFSFKVAARYVFSDAFTLRGSVGTGFRAPTGGQISTTNVSTRIADDGTPVAEGVFPPGGDIASVFGGVPLTDETSNQATLGIGLTPTDNLTLTVDYYFIELEDRITLSSDFTVGPAELAELIALGVPGAETIAQVSFFANDVTSETQGIDLVANYDWEWGAGNSAIAVAANWNDTEITKPGQYLDNEDTFNAEEELPTFRANVTFRHIWQDSINFMLRANYYGESKFASNSDFTVEAPQTFGSVVQFDVDLTFDFQDSYRLTIGGNNIFDDLPDIATGSEFCCGQLYRTSDPADWMGPFWFVRGTVMWD